MTTCSKCGGCLVEPGEIIKTDRPIGGVIAQYGHAPGCPDGILCDHKQLRRSCEICERDGRIAEMESTEREMRATFKTAHDLLDGAGVYCADGTHPQLLGRLAMLIDREKARIAELDRQLAEAHADADRRDRIISDAIVEEQQLSALKCKSLSEALTDERERGTNNILCFDEERKDLERQLAELSTRLKNEVAAKQSVCNQLAEAQREAAFQHAQATDGFRQFREARAEADSLRESRGRLEDAAKLAEARVERLAVALRRLISRAKGAVHFCETPDQTEAANALDAAVELAEEALARKED